VKTLKRYGVDDEKVGFKTASKAIDYIFKSRTKPSKEQIHKIIYKEK
jgi:hypothetical protein